MSKENIRGGAPAIPPPEAVHSRLVSTLEASGFPHALARVFAALMLAEGEGLSTSELTERLSISKASITNAMQMLLHMDLAERYRVPGSREAHYRILKGKWGPLMSRKLLGLGAVRQTAGELMEGAQSPAARERLEEMHDVYQFFEKEIDGVLARWNESHRTEER